MENLIDSLEKCLNRLFVNLQTIRLLKIKSKTMSKYITLKWGIGGNGYKNGNQRRIEKGEKGMRITSRIVCTKKENKGLTGTVTAYKGDSMVEVSFDNGLTKDCSFSDLIEIDDLANAGDIRFEVGERIYDIQYNSTGKILKVEGDKGCELYTVKLDNGKTVICPLLEEINFIVVK